MAFNRKPEKQILRQYRFEEFNQNSISKLISLRSTTHWHVLAESEQLQRESWNNTLSGPLAAGPHRAGGWGAAGLPPPSAGPLQKHWWEPPGISPTASCKCGLSPPPLQEGSQKGGVARELALPQGKSLRPQQGYSSLPKGVPIQTIQARIKLKSSRYKRIKAGWCR